MPLLSYDRRQYILLELEKNGRLHSNQLAEQLGVSKETIRRYLEALEQEQIIERVYGGAVKKTIAAPTEPPLLQRIKRNSAQKVHLAQLAAQCIPPNHVIAIGEGATLVPLADFLYHRSDLTIVTNNIAFVVRLLACGDVACGDGSDSSNSSDSFKGKLILLGGQLNIEHERTSGAITASYLEGLFVDKAFLSADGLTPDQGFTNLDSEAAAISKLMSKQAKETIVLVDDTKFGIHHLYKMLPLSSVHCIITNFPLHSPWQEVCEQNNICWKNG